MKRVLVGLSGGVDSAVAAYLLQKEGYEVCGVTLRTWDAGDGSESRCCEIDDARRIAQKLGIRYYTLNCVEEFSKKVVDPFVNSYLSGRTPNPCIECNRFLKWEKMLYAAKVMADVAVKLIESPEKIAEAKEEASARIKNRKK